MLDSISEKKLKKSQSLPNLFKLDNDDNLIKKNKSENNSIDSRSFIDLRSVNKSKLGNNLSSSSVINENILSISNNIDMFIMLSNKPLNILHENGESNNLSINNIFENSNEKSDKLKNLSNEKSTSQRFDYFSNERKPLKGNYGKYCSNIH